MVGYLFAGQGSQYIGMGKDLYEAFPESKSVFQQANQALGFDLTEICFAGKAEELKSTQICQLAVLTVDIAAFEAFKARGKGQGPRASYMAGLSLGEYAALVGAGVLKFSDALMLVRKRAELMQAAAVKYPGKMAAVIGLEPQALKKICQASGRVAMANLNCPGQIVISGEAPAVESAKQNCLAAGAKRVLDLEVSGAFHSELMREAADDFKNFITGFNFSDPETPLVSNVDALPEDKSTQVKGNLVKQIYSPVLWEDSMRFMLQKGVNQFFEFGPGKVLKGLMRKIEPAAQVTSIEKKEDVINLREG